MSANLINPFAPQPKRDVARRPLASDLSNELPPLSQEGGEPRRKPLTIQSAALYAKWGNALGAGFQVVPDVLIRHQAQLKLSASDIVVLLNLNMAWWQVGRMPFPRVGTIAKRMGASERTVQRALASLEDKKLIERRLVAGKQYYDLRPLAERLIKLAPTDPLYLRPEISSHVAASAAKMADASLSEETQDDFGPLLGPDPVVHEAISSSTTPSGEGGAVELDGE